MNYKEENIKLIESANCHYYKFTKQIVEEIVNKNITDVSNEEWRTLLQMIYPKNMIGSGLFQPILIFEISKNGKRIDPPIEAYDGINKALLSKIINHIEKNSNLKIENSWYEAKDKGKDK